MQQEEEREHRRLISLKSDYLFRRIFSDPENVDMLRSLLSPIVRLPADELEEITVLNPELPADWLSGKCGILDLKIRTRSGMMIDVEIQMRPVTAFPERIVFYGAKMLTAQIASGEDYRKLKRVICVAILDFDLTDEADFHNVFALRNVRSGALFTDIIEFHTIELRKLPSAGEGDLYNWMRLIAAEEESEMEMIASRGEIYEKALTKVRYFSADEKTRWMIESIEKARRDEVTRIAGAYEDGMAKGMAEGEVKGHAKGMAEGEAKGRAKGRTEGQEEIAIKLLAGGMDWDSVAGYTGLSLDRVGEIAAELSGDVL